MVGQKQPPRKKIRWPTAAETVYFTSLSWTPQITVEKSFRPYVLQCQCRKEAVLSRRTPAENEALTIFGMMMQYSIYSSMLCWNRGSLTGGGSEWVEFNAPPHRVLGHWTHDTQFQSHARKDELKAENSYGIALSDVFGGDFASTQEWLLTFLTARI